MRRNWSVSARLSGDCINEVCTTGERCWKTIGREDSWEEQHGEATEERKEEHGRLGWECACPCVCLRMEARKSADGDSRLSGSRVNRVLSEEVLYR